MRGPCKALGILGQSQTLSFICELEVVIVIVVVLYFVVVVSFDALLVMS